MNLPEGTHLAYIINSEAWYARAGDAPELYVMAADNEGKGQAWGFSAAERNFGTHGTAIYLKIFEDAFTAFTDIPEFFAALPGVAALAGVRKLLGSLGAVDETKREQ